MLHILMSWLTGGLDLSAQMVLGIQILVGQTSMPINLGPLFTALKTFILNILGACFSIWFLIKLARHAMEENKDPVKIGQDIVLTCIFLAIAFKGDVIITWATTVLG